MRIASTSGVGTCARRKVVVLSLLSALLVATAALNWPGAAIAQSGSAETDAYYPARHNWEKKTPEEVGMNTATLNEAVELAIASESSSPKDLGFDLSTRMTEPFDELVGPTKTRASLSGMVIRNGYIVAEWGDTKKVDMTFSVTKTFLSTVVGLAWQKGLIRDIHEPAKDYMPDDKLFNSEHNARITWDDLLRQTSDWRGTLWDKPAWADRPPRDVDRSDWPNRPLNEPGTVYKYNDVRVNLLALVALNVWRKPLPQVLRENVMDPIEASNTWRWHGYDNSWVMIDGQQMQSVSGGGHWGGGMFINAHDMARFGYLFLRNGQWKDHQIMSTEWIDMARIPGPANPSYGFMNWFLNTTVTGRDGSERRALPSAPESAVRFVGAGSNIIYVDWENDLVVVVRWIRGGPALDNFVGKVIESIE